MNSETAKNLDLPYDRLQWSGEEYILENLIEEVNGVEQAGLLFPNEVMFWIGYTFRYWHFLNGDASKEIYKQADAQMMTNCYWGFHTLDVAMAISDLKEICRQKQANL